MVSAWLGFMGKFIFSEKSEPTYIADKPKRSAGEEVINVRILTQVKVMSFLFVPDAGEYNIIGDGKVVAKIDPQGILKISLLNDSIDVKTFENNLGRYKSLKLTSTFSRRSFKMKVVSPERKPRYYDDNLFIYIENNYLRLINNTYLDNYIAGVTEAEAGTHSTVEFYKVQSILARTYALAHLYKHGPEGFNLCDQVHCQAFHGRTNDREIWQAIEESKGKVVVDEELQLITAAFHSNSGGQTVNSEDVWGSRTTYLRSVADSFSLKMPNARWERKMLISDWLDYLKLRHNYPVNDSAAKNTALNFKQWSRKVHLEYGNCKVPLKTVRTDLQLKSTFFSLEPKGDTLIFKGRGFGHGIGMCQEGAMHMTKAGYSHEDVLKFYYKHVYLVDLKTLNFFRD